MTHKQNMKVISQAVEEEIKRTKSQPYATIQDRRSQVLSYKSPSKLAGCYVILVDGKDVWDEYDICQTSSAARSRCNRLVRLLQDAYNEGRRKR